MNYLQTRWRKYLATMQTPTTSKNVEPTSLALSLSSLSIISLSVCDTKPQAKPPPLALAINRLQLIVSNSRQKLN